jgi:hypothetical protein
MKYKRMSLYTVGKEFYLEGEITESKMQSWGLEVRSKSIMLISFRKWLSEKVLKLKGKNLRTLELDVVTFAYKCSTLRIQRLGES